MKMKVARYRLLLLLLLTCITSHANNQVEFKKVNYQIAPYFFSKTFEKWLEKNWDSEENSIPPRIGNKELMTIIGVTAKQNETLSTKHTLVGPIIVAQLSPENHKAFIKGHQELLGKPPRILSDELFKTLVDKYDKRQAIQNKKESPFSD